MSRLDASSTTRFPRLLMAYRNLHRAKLRSALAVIAVVIGVTAVGSMGLFGTTLQYSVQQSTAELANEVVVTAPQSGTAVLGGAPESLSREQVGAIENLVEDAPLVRMQNLGRLPIESRTREQQHTVYEMANPAKLFDAVAGDIPSRPRSGGAVLGAAAADALGVTPGDTIVIAGDPMTVRGVYDRPPLPGVFRPINSAVIVPADLDRDGVSHVVLRLENSQRATELETTIQTSLPERTEDVDVATQSQTSTAITGIFTTIQTVLMGVASIALLVASVGILNIMLMSTIERREEIGVLRAVGFGKRDVLVVLLSEAVFLGVIGAAVGALLSLGVGMVINQVMIGNPLEGFLPRSALFVALAFAVGVLASLLGGLYPARTAANERPVEALEN